MNAFAPNSFSTPSIAFICPSKRRPQPGLIPFAATAHLLNRRFEEAIEVLLKAQSAHGPNAALSSGLAAAYHGLAFQTLADQVRRSVRSVRGNQWMSRIGHPDDYPLSVRRELSQLGPDGLYPILRETTPVRMDLSHSGWSDIFFLGMDFPEGARVLNVSIDLACAARTLPRRSLPSKPISASSTNPCSGSTSVDLGATADVATFAEVFDFARDYLGLLKAAVIASGLVPPAMEGSRQPLEQICWRRLAGPGRGIEIVSRVRDIPKGSRLAVSTNLLACLIAVCMRATNQIHSLTGTLAETDRRLVAARAILGEWLGGSGGGWQDSGGVWPGMKLIQGVLARGRRSGIRRQPRTPVAAHHVLRRDEVSAETREKLQQSLVLVHGGMAQDVGPILEMVTEKYLLRSEAEWSGREQAIAHPRRDRRRVCAPEMCRPSAPPPNGISSAPSRPSFPGPAISTPRRSSSAVASRNGRGFLGILDAGRNVGRRHGFHLRPAAKPTAQDRLQRHHERRPSATLERAVPFAMEPVVYDFAINEHGTRADLLTATQR